MDALRQAFEDRTPEASMHADNSAVDGASFVKTTPKRPPGHDAKAKKAATNKCKAATTATESVGAIPGTKTSDVGKPPTKK
jgi:hypothetical protein